MKKIFYTAVVISGIILLSWYSPSRNLLTSPSFSNPIYPHANVAIAGENFDVLVAETDELKEKGLSGFKGLEEHEAMLFSYEKASNLPFWMKDMLFSIDILWLDADSRIIYFENSASPDSYPKVFSPGAYAQHVIELRAGTLERLEVKIGDTVTISPKK